MADIASDDAVDAGGAVHGSGTCGEMKGKVNGNGLEMFGKWMSKELHENEEGKIDGNEGKGMDAQLMQSSWRMH